MQLKLIFTILILRTLTFLLKITGKGRGTALPGLIIEKYLPSLVPYILSKSPYTILITGTNGKTSTRNILTTILSDNNLSVIQNRSGSNMIRGIISEIILQMNIFGKIDSKYAVFEVEEATMPKICKYIKPEQIIVTNIFRDQLDAYGEIERTLDFIQKSLKLSPKTSLIINGDDPMLSSITSESIQHFGIDPKYTKEFKYEGKPSEKHNFDKATNIEITKNFGSKFTYQKDLFETQLIGTYQIYNILASILSAQEIGIDIQSIKKSIIKVSPAFGRGETIKTKQASFQIFLIKNPAGANNIISLLNQTQSKKIILALNDKIADGRDVSWIWDSNFEELNKLSIEEIICTGSRGADLILRLKHAMGGLETLSPTEFVSKQETRVRLLSIEEIIKLKGEYAVLPTYTAMLEIRKLLTGNSLNV